MVKIAPRRSLGRRTTPKVSALPRESTNESVEAAKGRGAKVIVIKRPAILFEGGPWDRWSRYVDDTEAYIRSLEVSGAAFSYRKTGRHKIHPGTGQDVTSEIWVHAPTEGSRP